MKKPRGTSKRTVRNVAAALREHGLDFIAGRIPESDPEDWYVFSNVRNELLRLPYFLQYYRNMGTRLFVIIDNNSNDGTLEYLEDQADVFLFRARGSYAESRYGIDWMNAALHCVGSNRWCLTVDADELLVFPYCERLKLHELTRYLDARRATALSTFLLDMYAKGSICEAKYHSGMPFLSVCPYFDQTGYLTQSELGPTQGRPIRGGLRYRLFWDGYERERPSPFLAKVPLVRWSEDARYEASTHQISNTRVSDVSGALLHFKYFDDFPARVEEEVTRREHFNCAAQYLAYWEVLSKYPDVSGFYENSARYEGSEQLVELGLLDLSSTFKTFAGVSQEAARNQERTYCVRPEYQCTSAPVEYSDTIADSLLYQLEVYQRAAEYIEQAGIRRVLDVGCGYGMKLERYILPTGAAITGVDKLSAVEFCRKRHEFGEWFVDDIEEPYANLGITFDLIICADVIEHLRDPDTLFEYARRWSHLDTKVFISTPERDRRRGPEDLGPPGNPAHVREWSGGEFQRYLETRRLIIEDHRIVELKAGMETCQLALCSWNWRSIV